MSVFTSLSLSQIQPLLAAAKLTAHDVSAATEGIENSNFFVTATTTSGKSRELVLTIVENLNFEEVRWSQQLLTQLANEGLAVPEPMGELQTFDNKPVVLAPKLPGHHPQAPTHKQVHTIGNFLAKLHRSKFNLPSPMIDERQRLQTLAHHLPLLPTQQRYIADELLTQWLATNGTRCLIHGDLFRDNALFCDDQLSAVIDFYNASYELPVYDIAVALNDWTLTAAGEERPDLTAALLAGYDEITPQIDLTLLPLACAVAALRFWLSRLDAQQQAVTAQAGRGSKPASEFAQKFALRVKQLLN